MARRPVNYIEPGLPNFFLAEGKQLVGSTQVAVERLNCEGRRNFMVVRDECAFARAYSVVYGLDPDDVTAPLIVGGAHPGCGLVRRADAPQNLEKEKLATLSVATCLKGLDRRTDLWQVQQVPRLRVTNMDYEFEEIGRVAQACSLTNHIKPPQNNELH